MENILGKRIKKLRKEKKLSQLEYAKLLNINNSTLSQYEAGNRVPSDDIKKKIADLSGTTVDYLLGNSDIRNPYEDKDKYAPVDDIEEAMKIILEQPGLMLKGSILSDESKIILANAIQMGLRTAEEIENKKNKGDNND